MANSLVPRRRSPLALAWREPFPRLGDLEDVLSRFLGNGEGWVNDAMTPSIDLSETEKSVEVRMDLPGVKAEEIDVQVHANLLTISGERKEEKEEKGRTFHRVERREGSFSRTVSLPCEVDESKVAAEYKDGVLHVTMPKSAGTEIRKIKVKA